MNVSEPSMAPMGPPDTGASTNIRLLDEGIEEATERMVAVSMVPHSIRILEGEEVLLERAEGMRPVVGSR